MSNIILEDEDDSVYHNRKEIDELQDEEDEEQIYGMTS